MSLQTTLKRIIFLFIILLYLFIFIELFICQDRLKSHDRFGRMYIISILSRNMNREQTNSYQLRMSSDYKTGFVGIKVTFNILDRFSCHK